MDPRERFTRTAREYERFRPSYPEELLDWLVADLGPGACVADIGCGTGISTRLFADRGFDVVGVDPNEEMLGRARAAGGARYVRGEAIATGLDAGAFDMVVAAQAFHWFDVAKALSEFRRILRPEGRCAAFWNVRDLTPGFMAEYDFLLRAASSEYAILEKPAATAAAIRAAGGVTDILEAEFSNAQSFDREGLFGRAYSSSYVVHGVADKPAFDSALGALFERHAEQGVIRFHYRSIALSWRLA